LLALQNALSLRDGRRFLNFVRKSRKQPQRDFAPAVAVIIPTKGVDTGFHLNLDAFLNQDYPRAQMIFVVASEDDPAYGVLATRLKSRTAPPALATLKTSVVTAGYSNLRGEKVNNLIRGLADVGPEAEVLVFADIDARPHDDWLRSLVAPLADPAVTVSTGFRWYLPGAGFASQLRAAWDTSIATLLGDHGNNFAWGGSMAIRASDFKRLQIAERYWERTASDDYSLTRAVREARGRIRFEPRCLLASKEDSGFRKFLQWANRQIIITRVYAPRLWTVGLIAHSFYCSTVLTGFTLLLLPITSGQQRLEIAALLAITLVLATVKAHIRTVVAREMFPEEASALARFGSRYWQLAPLVPWVMLMNFLVAGFTRRIEWRGTEYELRSMDELQVLRRERSSD
jgi:ceramide glucosyltransferase